MGVSDRDQPLIYRIDEDPSERFPIPADGATKAGESWPTAATAVENPHCSCRLTWSGAAEYAAQLAIATKAVEGHIATLVPVPNQVRVLSSAFPLSRSSIVCLMPSDFSLLARLSSPFVT